MDIKPSSERSKNMSAIRSKNTKPEVYFRKLLFADGFRYRCNVKNLEGHPDLWLRKYDTAIFIHGCFWHRHPGCKYCTTPKTNMGFWKKKFLQNQARDAYVSRTLCEDGIKVLVVWECTVKHMKKDSNYRSAVLEKVEEFIQNEAHGQYLEI